MEMRLFMRSLLRWWFIPVAMLALGVGGVWFYHDLRDKAKASATVAILQTAAPAPGEYVPPQIGFDALADNQSLSERIAARLADGTTPEQIRNKLSITLKSNLTRVNPSLLYNVTIEDANEQRAIMIDNIAVDEAKKLFAEINTPDPKDVRQAFQAQMDSARQDVDNAQAAFTNFQAQNDAYALTQRRDRELNLISQLRMAQVSSSAAQPVTPGGDGPALAAARGELSRLTALEPQYNQLTFEQGLAQAAVGRLEQRVSDLQIGGAPDARQLADAQSQLADAQGSLTSAQDALSTFKSQNTVGELAGAIQSQMTLVNQLTVSNATSQAGADAVNQAIAAEQAELTRLETLQPQYDQLAGDLQKAETELASLEQRQQSVIAGQTLPAQAQVKPMQDATLQGDLLFTLLTYGLAVFLAVFVAMTAVYVLAYFEKLPPTLEDLEQALGRPVITRVPLGGS